MPIEGKKIEKFVRWSTCVNNIAEAFTFVMEHLDDTGAPYPNVEITACHNDVDIDTFDHYHVAVFGGANV